MVLFIFVKLHSNIKKLHFKASKIKGMEEKFILRKGPYSYEHTQPGTL